MAQFEATIRLQELVGTDKTTVRRAVEERLRAAGLNQFQIVSIAIPAAITPPALLHKTRGSTDRAAALGGPLLIAGVALWALWFLWMIAA